MKKLLIVFIGIFFLNFCYASCSDDQIDVNSASLEKLDELTGIGPVKAQAIIDERPFDFIDELIDVYGIGEATLEKIKNQGLACVDEEDAENSQGDADSTKSENPPSLSQRQDSTDEEISTKEEKQIEIIKLNSKNPKDIKIEENSEELEKNNYAIYGFGAFCVLIVFLFVIKNKKGKFKNEFDEN